MSYAAYGLMKVSNHKPGQWRRCGRGEVKTQAALRKRVHQQAVASCLDSPWSEWRGQRNARGVQRVCGR